MSLGCVEHHTRLDDKFLRRVTRSSPAATERLRLSSYRDSMELEASTIVISAISCVVPIYEMSFSNLSNAPSHSARDSGWMVFTSKEFRTTSRAAASDGT